MKKWLKKRRVPCKFVVCSFVIWIKKIKPKVNLDHTFIFRRSKNKTELKKGCKTMGVFKYRIRRKKGVHKNIRTKS